MPDWIANVGLPDWWPGWQFVCLTAIPAVVLAVLSMKGSKAWQIMLAVLCTLSILGVGYVQGVDDGEVARSTLESSTKAVAELAEQRRAMTAVSDKLADALATARTIAGDLKSTNETIVQVAKERSRAEAEEIERAITTAELAEAIDPVKLEFRRLIVILERTLDEPVDSDGQYLAAADGIARSHAEHLLKNFKSIHDLFGVNDFAEWNADAAKSAAQTIDALDTIVFAWSVPSQSGNEYRSRVVATVAAAYELEKHMILFEHRVLARVLKIRSEQARQRESELNQRLAK